MPPVIGVRGALHIATIYNMLFCLRIILAIIGHTLYAQLRVVLCTLLLLSVFHLIQRAGYGYPYRLYVACFSAMHVVVFVLCQAKRIALHTLLLVRSI